MEVKLEKRYPLKATVAQAWAVLSDIRATAACMPGATITEQIDALIQGDGEVEGRPRDHEFWW
jgi:carbon monoxide dehydrogenase subunit G